MTKQYITRTTAIDTGHRVMSEMYKCFNCHGHRYKIELTYEFEQMEEIGYAVDFKEIKRVHCAYLDDYLDHGFALNPHDTILIEAMQKVGTKLWIMSLNGENYCNPSVENLSKEIFLAVNYLTDRSYPLIKLHKVRVYETENCLVDTYSGSISDEEKANFLTKHEQELIQYADSKGVLEYDDRKAKKLDIELQN